MDTQKPDIQKPQPSVLLMGGGYALSRLADRLPPHSCVLTTRSPEKQAALQASGKLCEIFDIADVNSLAAILGKYPSLKTVIDSIPPPDSSATKTETVIHEINECLALSSIQKVLYLSTTGVYGRVDGGVVDETTPPQPVSEKAKARLKVEENYRKSRLRSCALRISGIYGPGRGIGQALRRGNYQLASQAGIWSNRIHVDDLVTTIQHLLELKELPPVLCVSDDKPAQLDEVIAYYCSRFGLPAPANANFENTMARKPSSQPNQRVSNKLLREKLGINLNYPSFLEGAETEFEEE